MYDEPDDEHDFWGGQTWTTRRTPTEHHRDEPTRQLRRVQADPRERRADVPVRHRPALMSRSTTGGASRFRLPDRLFGRNLRTVDGRIDPFIARLGMIVLAVVLLVPVAVSLRPEHRSILRSAPTGGATAIPDTPLFDDAPATTGAAAGAEVVVAETAAPSSDPVTTAAPVATEAAPVTVAASNQRTEAVTTQTTAKKSTPVTQPPVEQVATTSSCGSKYTIARGDSWIGIARRAGVTTKALLAANNAKATTAIYPGRSICLPAGASQPTATTAKPVTTTTPKPATTTTAKPKPATTTTAKPKPATTTTKAPTPTTAPARTYSRAEAEAIIREVWPDELEDKAVAIATRESNLQPTARNSCCLGLFQIYFNVHKSWLAQLGVTSATQLLDPRVNANAALTLYYRSGGWGPWGG